MGLQNFIPLILTLSWIFAFPNSASATPLQRNDAKSNTTIVEHISRSKSQHPLLLVVSFDGFAVQYLSRPELTPTLHAIRDEGVTAPYMEPQFPTKTFVNHQSIATGLYPEDHGIIDNTLYDPLYDRVLNGFLDDPEFWNYHNDVLPFYIWNERAGEGRVSGCYMWAGSSTGYGDNYTIFPTHYLTYNETIPWETRVSSVIEWMTDPTQPANVIFLYHNEPDTQGHATGTGDDLTWEMVKATDDRLKELVEALKEAGLYEDTNLIVTSDHGMQTIHKDYMMNISQVVDPTLYNWHGGSPVVHIRPNDSSNTHDIYTQFKTHALDRNYEVYLREELDFLHYSKSRRIMDIVLVSDPGYVFHDMGVNDNGIRGMHGFDLRSREMRTIFFARGPLFKEGYVSTYPISNLDLFPLFAEIAGVTIPPDSHNGSFERVAQFLKKEYQFSTTTSPTTLSTTTQPSTTLSTTQPPTTLPTTQPSTTLSSSGGLMTINRCTISLLMLSLAF